MDAERPRPLVFRSRAYKTPVQGVSLTARIIKRVKQERGSVCALLIIVITIVNNNIMTVTRPRPEKAVSRAKSFDDVFSPPVVPFRPVSLYRRRFFFSVFVFRSDFFWFFVLSLFIIVAREEIDPAPHVRRDPRSRTAASRAAAHVRSVRTGPAKAAGRSRDGPREIRPDYARRRFDGPRGSPGNNGTRGRGVRQSGPGRTTGTGRRFRPPPRSKIRCKFGGFSVKRKYKSLIVPLLVGQRVPRGTLGLARGLKGAIFVFEARNPAKISRPDEPAA